MQKFSLKAAAFSASNGNIGFFAAAAAAAVIDKSCLTLKKWQKLPNNYLGITQFNVGNTAKLQNCTTKYYNKHLQQQH